MNTGADNIQNVTGGAEAHTGCERETGHARRHAAAGQRWMLITAVLATGFPGAGGSVLISNAPR
jgi:hypothetical protein